MIQRKRISEDAQVSVPFSARDRKLVLERTFADEELLAQLRKLPTTGKHAASYTLYDIEDLMGYIAFEANHTDDLGLQREFDRLHSRLEAEMMKYDDGNWQQG